jgi:uncharacterized protein YndB with AHSA1/START domain
MSQPPLIKNTITILAPASKVWDALINPEQTKKYMFGCKTVSDWNVESLLEWKAEIDGKDMVFVTGHIERIEPEKILVYTVFDPNSTMENIPENYLTVTYQLIENEGQTKLNVTQGDYGKVAEGERRYNDAYNNGEGWNPILVEIKKIVESLV